MVQIPNFTLDQADGALGTQPDDAIHAKAGIASQGPIGMPILIAGRGPLLETFGSGPLVEDVALQVALTQRPVLCVRINPGVAGVVGALVRSGNGAGGASLTAAGGNTSTAVPSLAIGGQAMAVAVRVTTAGANLAALPEYVYSLDGGLTWSAPAVAVAGPVPLGNSGLTLAWANGTFVANNTWAGQATPSGQQGTAALVVSGTPTDAFDVALEVLRGAPNLAANLATFRLSLDGGANWGPETAMPVSGVVQPAGTGLTLTFSNGGGTAFERGDRFAFRTLAPGFTLSDLNNAWGALLASPLDVEGVHVVGATDDTIAAAVDVNTVAAIAARKPRWALLEARAATSGETEAQWMTTIANDYADFVSSLGRVFVAAGTCDVVSVLSGRARRTSIGILAAIRAAQVPISEDLAWVGRGALPGVLAIQHDEDARPGLNFARFITARTHQGFAGYYLTNPVSMAVPGSDFELLQHRRVWDRAYRALRGQLTRLLSQDLLVNPADVDPPLVPGAVDEVEAAAIEAAGRNALNDALVRTRPRHATAADVTVDRTQNLISTEEIAVDFAITPKGYVKAIRGSLGFTNPARTAG